MSINGFKILFERAGFHSITITTPGQLDVHIVIDAIKTNSNINLSRFEKLLLNRDQETLSQFQKFLSTTCLSSHCWIFARK